MHVMKMVNTCYYVPLFYYFFLIIVLYSNILTQTLSNNNPKYSFFTGYLNHSLKNVNTLISAILQLLNPFLKHLNTNPLKRVNTFIYLKLQFHYASILHHLQKYTHLISRICNYEYITYHVHLHRMVTQKKLCTILLMLSTNFFLCLNSYSNCETQLHTLDKCATKAPFFSAVYLNLGNVSAFLYEKGTDIDPPKIGYLFFSLSYLFIQIISTTIHLEKMHKSYFRVKIITKDNKLISFTLKCSHVCYLIATPLEYVPVNKSPKNSIS